MYYQNYEDYMRSVLGYPQQNVNTYSPYEENFYNSCYENDCHEKELPYNRVMSDSEQLELYPEIYKIVRPMAQKICAENKDEINKANILKMTEEIYRNIETNMNTVVNVSATVDRQQSNDKNVEQGKTNSLKQENRSNTDNRVNRTNTDRNEIRASIDSKTARTEVNRNEILDRETETRRIRSQNYLLKDLIRIIILNELFGNRPPMRPPFPGRPPRPPFPGEPGGNRPPLQRPPFPGMPGGSGPNPPPIQPRDYENYYNF